MNALVTRQRALKQFECIYRQAEGFRGDDLMWGDEVRGSRVCGAYVFVGFLFCSKLTAPLTSVRLTGVDVCWALWVWFGWSCRLLLRLDEGRSESRNIVSPQLHADLTCCKALYWSTLLALPSEGRLLYRNAHGTAPTIAHLCVVCAWSCRQLEYAILRVDHGNKRARVSTRAASVIKELQIRCGMVRYPSLFPWRMAWATILLTSHLPNVTLRLLLCSSE